MDNIYLNEAKKRDVRDLPSEIIAHLAQAQAIQNIAEALLYEEEDDDDYFI